MRWIADEDKECIEMALDSCEQRAPGLAAVLLRSVLSNMRRLEVEQPAQPPHIVPLSDEQHRALYPERY